MSHFCCMWHIAETCSKNSPEDFWEPKKKIGLVQIEHHRINHRPQTQKMLNVLKKPKRKFHLPNEVTLNSCRHYFFAVS